MSNIHQFDIGEITARYWLKADEPAHELTVPEIFVDGQALSGMIGVERDLAFINCDFTSDDPNVIRSAIAQYTGQAAPCNQFGSPRIVLYRCHCGSDYCGVISFSLVEKGGLILWRNLSYKTETGIIDTGVVEQAYDIRFIEEMAFNKVQYLAEFKRYRQTRGPK